MEICLVIPLTYDLWCYLVKLSIILTTNLSFSIHFQPTSRMTYLFGFILTTVGIKKIDGLIDILMCVLPIVQLFKQYSSKCRLFICTYNATTYIDCLFAPTVIFWNPDRWESNPKQSIISSFSTVVVYFIHHLLMLLYTFKTFGMMFPLGGVLQMYNLPFCNAFSRSHSDIAQRFSHIMRGPSDLPDFTN